MIGLNLTKPELVASGPSAGLYLFKYKTIKVLNYCSGLTKLANSYIFNLLSSYNPETGTGSNFRRLATSPIIHGTSKDFAVIMITEELDSLKQRFRAFQKNSGQVLPAKELLRDAQILGIEVSGTGAIVRMRLENEEGNAAFVEV